MFTHYVALDALLVRKLQAVQQRAALSWRPAPDIANTDPLILAGSPIAELAQADQTLLSEHSSL